MLLQCWESSGSAHLGTTVASVAREDRSRIEFCREVIGSGLHCSSLSNSRVSMCVLIFGIFVSLVSAENVCEALLTVSL